MEVERMSIVYKNLKIEEIYRKKEDNLYYGIVRVAISGEKIPESFRGDHEFFGEKLTEDWGLSLRDSEGKPIRRVDKVLYADYDLKHVKEVVESIVDSELAELATCVRENLRCGEEKAMKEGEESG